MRLAILIAALAVGGCGGDAPRGGPASDPSPGPASPGDPGPIEVRPVEGLVDVRPQRWERAEPLGPRTVRVTFYGGVEECEGLDRVEVDETAGRVTITVFTGRVPTAEVCIEIAVLKAVRVELDAAVGGREIVDGAA